MLSGASMNCVASICERDRRASRAAIADPMTGRGQPGVTGADELVELRIAEDRCHVARSSELPWALLNHLKDLNRSAG